MKIQKNSFHDNDHLVGDDLRFNLPEGDERRGLMWEYILANAVGHEVEMYCANYDVNGHPSGFSGEPAVEIRHQFRPANYTQAALIDFYDWYYVNFESWYSMREETATAYLEAWNRWKNNDRRVRNGDVLRIDCEEQEYRREIERRDGT